MAAGPLRALLADQPTPDDAAVAAVHARAAEIMRPPGALAWLDDIAAWVAGWQRTARPRVERPAALVFAADHGIAAAEFVSAVAPKVTAAMFAAAERGRGTINAFARIAGASVHAVDVGIARPTADIRTDAALTPERFDAVTATAVADAIRSRPSDVSIVLTGRDAPTELIDVADTVTVMRKVKHAYDAGITALRGIEY